MAQINRPSFVIVWTEFFSFYSKLQLVLVHKRSFYFIFIFIFFYFLKEKREIGGEGGTKGTYIRKEG